MSTSKSRKPAGSVRVTSPVPVKKATAKRVAAKKKAGARPRGNGSSAPAKKPASQAAARAAALLAAAAQQPPVPVSKPVHVATPHAQLPIAPTPDKPKKPSKADKAAEAARDGRVRDKFSMPEADYALIDKLKLSAKRSGLKAKKGDLLRLGLRALDALSSSELQDRLLTMRVHDKRSAKQHAD